MNIIMDTELGAAYELGRAAKIAGKHGAPCLNRKMMSMLKGNSVGEGIPLLKAYTQGWDKA